MSSIQSLYHQLRAQAFQDPIVRGLFEGTMSWGEACTQADEQVYHEYCSSGEGEDILNAVREVIDRKNMKARRSIQWAEDVQVHTFETPMEVKRSAPVQVVTTTVLFNPNQIKTLVARNLPRDVTSNELTTIFSKHGPIRDVYIPKNLDQNSPYYGTIKGFALIKFMSHTDSTRGFLAEKNKLCLRGKSITIEFAKEDR